MILVLEVALGILFAEIITFGLVWMAGRNV